MILVLLVSLATAIATWTLGWWAVAIIAIVAGVVLRAVGGHPWHVALGCLVGWVLLMLVDAAMGPFGTVARMVSGAMSIPSGALMIVTLLYPALIGWSGATLGALGGSVRRNASATV